MRFQIKKISGEESHSSEKKKIRIQRKMSEHWNGNSEKKAQSYRIEVKILTLKQNFSVSAQKSSKNSKINVRIFRKKNSEKSQNCRKWFKDSKKNIRMPKTEFQHSVSFKVNSEFKYQMSDI